MTHWLVFGRAELLAADLSSTLARLASAPASPQLAELRRDVIASDPAWTGMTLLPRPADPAADRYLGLVLAQPPPPEQVRDLRYVAARHGLAMAHYVDDAR